MNQNLTTRQQFIADTIERLTRENKSTPTVRELCKATGIKSPNGIMVHLTALRKKGVVAPSAGKRHRGVRLLNSKVCPCCGQKLRKESA